MIDPFQLRNWQLAHGRCLEVGPQSRIMGILNVTPNSFSDGGNIVDANAALARAQAMISNGADIIDIGGESTKPGAGAVSGELERSRIFPVIKLLTKETDCIISVDTYRAETAECALSAGAHIVNDVWGAQKEPEIADVVAKHSAGLCIMHTGRGREILSDVIEDQNSFLKKSLSIAEAAGVGAQSIVLDPGFGFAKETADENLHLLNRLEELHHFGFPLLVGTSRKRFLGAITGKTAPMRDVATAATSVIARQKGATLFRVHDVGINKDALAVCDALLGAAHKKGIGL